MSCGRLINNSGCMQSNTLLKSLNMTLPDYMLVIQHVCQVVSNLPTLKEEGDRIIFFEHMQMDCTLFPRVRFHPVSSRTKIPAVCVKIGINISVSGIQISSAKVLLIQSGKSSECTLFDGSVFRSFSFTKPTEVVWSHLSCDSGGSTFGSSGTPRTLKK